MIIIFKDGKTQSIGIDKIQRIEYQTGPTVSKTYTWTFQRIGDCPGNDINTTLGSAVPAANLCNEKTVGLSAVCWDSAALCTYKSVMADSCTGGRNPGNLYKCMEMSDIRPQSALEIPVTLYWHMADNADVYLNGVPLRPYDPSFRTRRDGAPLPPFTAQAVRKDGDVFTVGGRRGGSFGFMLIAVDAAGRVVFKTDAQTWKVYMPGERADWYLPSVAKASPTSPVTVQQNPWPPQVELNKKFNNPALSIWGPPSERFCYLTATVHLGDEAASGKTVPQGLNITGTYKCRDGLMSFVQTGSSVTGTYNWSGGGTTSGQMVGSDYVGNFRDKGGGGDFQYRFSPDGRGFQMEWRMSGETRWRDGGRCEKVN